MPEQLLDDQRCLLLALLCDTSRDLGAGASLYLGTAAGGLLSCTAGMAARLLGSILNGTPSGYLAAPFPSLLSLP